MGSCFMQCTTDPLNISPPLFPQERIVRKRRVHTSSTRLRRGSHYIQTTYIGAIFQCLGCQSYNNQWLYLESVPSTERINSYSNSPLAIAVCQALVVFCVRLSDWMQVLSVLVLRLPDGRYVSKWLSMMSPTNRVDTML